MTSPPGIGPTCTIYDTLCAGRVRLWYLTRPYPPSCMAPIQSQHPEFGSGMHLLSSLSMVGGYGSRVVFLSTSEHALR